MSADRVCVLGCTVRDVHFATCPDFGKEEEETCRGCAPAVARDGALICDRCYRRIRFLLRDAPDLVGRLRYLADPGSARSIEWRPGSGMTAAPAPVADDLVDASDDVMRTLRQWAVTADRDSTVMGGMPAGAGPEEAFEFAARCVRAIFTDLDRVVNNQAEVVELAELVLTRHPANADGVRPFWSVQDAVDRYRLERPDDDRYADPTVGDGIVSVGDVPEPAGDQLITRAQAVALLTGGPTSAASAERKLRRWMNDGELVARIVQGLQGQRVAFRRGEVLAARDRATRRVASTTG